MVLVELASFVHLSPLWVWLMGLLFSARNDRLDREGYQAPWVPSSDLPP